MANIKAESNNSGGILLTSQKLRDPLTKVFANLSVESLLNLRLTNKHLQTAVDNFIKQKLEQEVPGKLESLEENPTINNILLLYKQVEPFIECKEYFSKLSNSDSDKILKTHCLAYLICKYPSNTKTKDYFIENGADLNAAEKLLQSLKAEEDLNLYLKRTFTWDSLYLLKTILLLGADFGYALIRQTEAGKTERVKLLLAADKQTNAVNAKGKYGRTALMAAAGEGRTKTVKALLERNEIDVNATDKDGWTALIWAARYGYTETVKALLTHSKIEVNATDNDGTTALMEAACNGYTEKVKALLAQNEIDVNAKDKDGKTALMEAARYGRSEAIQALLEHNEIDVNATDNNGKTALMCAARRGHTEAIQALLAHNEIDVNATDNDGKTALSLAIENGHTEIANLLKTHIANKAKESQRNTPNTKDVDNGTNNENSTIDLVSNNPVINAYGAVKNARSSDDNGHRQNAKQKSSLRLNK